MINIVETEFQGVKIPANCALTRRAGESSIEEGLVIIDKNGNEWVWVKVPKTNDIYQTSGLGIVNFTDEECEKIYFDLKKYVSSNEESQDIWYSGCGIDTSNEYHDFKKAMLKSIYENGGFYIGRYEVGTQTPRKASSEELTKPIIQKDMYPYNYVTCSQAQGLCQQLSLEERKASLMFGIQWDLVCKYLETNAKNPGESTANIKEAIRNNSVDFGNYRDAKFLINSESTKYLIYNASSPVYGIWNKIEHSYEKSDSINNWVLLTTGATQRNSLLNIYDLAGNLSEWTLQFSGDQNNPCNNRGGNFSHYGRNKPVTAFGNQYTIDKSTVDFGYRAMLY